MKTATYIAMLLAISLMVSACYSSYEVEPERRQATGTIPSADQDREFVEDTGRSSSSVGSVPEASDDREIAEEGSDKSSGLSSLYEPCSPNIGNCLDSYWCADERDFYPTPFCTQKCYVVFDGACDGAHECAVVVDNATGCLGGACVAWVTDEPNRYIGFCIPSM